MNEKNQVNPEEKNQIKWLITILCLTFFPLLYVIGVSMTQ
jgi:hypothetical protein